MKDKNTLHKKQASFRNKVHALAQKLKGLPSSNNCNLKTSPCRDVLTRYLQVGNIPDFSMHKLEFFYYL